MADHIKPTQQELDESIKQVSEQLDKQTPEPATKPPEDTKEPEKQETTPEEKQDIKVEEEQHEEDYKKKFTESSREAQILHARNKQLNDAVERANNLPDPNDDELQKEYIEWDTMSDTEKKLARKSYINDRRFSMIDEVTKESKNIVAWNEKVDAYIDDPKTLTNNPQLEGKTDEFKLFATKPTRRGLDMEDLVLAFNGHLVANPPKKSKGKMFETGTGGSNEKSKPSGDKISIDQANTLRETNYKMYAQYLKAGKIENAV